MSEAALDLFGPDFVQRGSGRPKQYKNAEGARLVGVTTVTDILPKFLGKYYNDHGLAGRNMVEAREWDRATDIGSYIHDVIVATIHNEPSPPTLEGLRPEQEAGVQKCEAEWLKWYRRTDLRFEVTELPLVSERLQFAGTLDAVARDPDGKLVLVDWKTSSAIYGDYLAQVAAYGLLWNENNEEQITGGYQIVRFSKENGDVEDRRYPDLEDGLRVFLLARELYDALKPLTKRAK